MEQELTRLRAENAVLRQRPVKKEESDDKGAIGVKREDGLVEGKIKIEASKGAGEATREKGETGKGKQSGGA